jgi:phage shock protein C
MYRYDTLYRARDGLLFGVCLGLARWRGFQVFTVRLAVILITLFTGLWPGVAVYALAAFLLRPEPVLPPTARDEADFYERFAGSRAAGLRELGQRLERLGSRVRNMEDIVTRHNFDWEERLKK